VRSRNTARWNPVLQVQVSGWSSRSGSRWQWM